MFSLTPAITPPLDSGIVHAALWNREFRRRCAAASEPLAIALARPDGTVSRFDFATLPHTAANAALNLRYVERLVKFLLWSRGASRVIIGGNPALAAELRAIYSKAGARNFDVEFFAKIYGALEIESCAFDAAPASCETAIPLGRHLDGYRIGFDLGGSDRKVAALQDGNVVFSEEIVWDPYFQSNPQYHLDGIQDSLHRAAAHLPRVDAIGGSAAGVYVNNQVKVASLFRGVSKEDFDTHVRDLFRTLRQKWNGIPFDVVNDGEVTALAASMSLGVNSVLGVSMGTSTAGGFVTAEGNITSWLNELAFAPVDYRPDGPADEWSGDRGCGVQFFSQQAVGRLIPASGLDIASSLPLPERLVKVQERMAAGDERAAQIYQTIGTCFGYAIAHWSDFYDLRHVLILGRVTSGAGGDVILREAQSVLAAEFPTLAAQVRFHMPDEKDKRHGQAIAAASLPALG